MTPAPRDQLIEFNIISKELPHGFAGKNVLEIACNAGGLSLLMERAGANVTALEPVEPFASQAEFVKDFFGLKRLTLARESVYNIHKLEYNRDQGG